MLHIQTKCILFAKKYALEEQYSYIFGKKEEKKSPKTHKKRFLVFILHFFYLLKAIFFSSKKLVLVRHSRASLIVVRNKKGTKCGLGYPLPLLGTKSQPLLKTRV